MGHPVCLLLEGDHPPLPAGCSEVSEPHGTQSPSKSVLKLGLVLQGRRLGPDGGSNGTAGCLLGRLPEEVWIRLVCLVLRCLNMHLPERLPEDPTRPGFHGERLFVEEEAVWQTVWPWKYL